MTSSSWASRLTTAERQRVVAPPGTVPAERGQVRERRLARGTGKPGKRYCSNPRSTEHAAASAAAPSMPSRPGLRHVRPQRAGAGRQREQLRLAP